MAKTRTLLAVGTLIGVAAGFAVGLFLFPMVEEERREFVDTHAFLKGYMQPGQLGEGWQAPNATSFGAPSSGKSAELKLPVDTGPDNDIELLFDF